MSEIQIRADSQQPLLKYNLMSIGYVNEAGVGGA